MDPGEVATVELAECRRVGSSTLDEGSLILRMTGVHRVNDDGFHGLDGRAWAAAA
jgi:hypothetical protein